MNIGMQYGFIFRPFTKKLFEWTEIYNEHKILLNAFWSKHTQSIIRHLSGQFTYIGGKEWTHVDIIDDVFATIFTSRAVYLKAVFVL